MLHCSAPPICPDSPHIWLLWFFSKTEYCRSLRGKWGGQEKEICEEKGVENIRKARRRERTRRHGQKHISRKRQSEQRRHVVQRPNFLFIFSLKITASKVSHLSVSRSQYGTVPVLQVACRSVQPQPLLHLFCSYHMWLLFPHLSLIWWPLNVLTWNLLALKANRFGLSPTGCIANAKALWSFSVGN